MKSRFPMSGEVTCHTDEPREIHLKRQQSSMMRNLAKIPLFSLLLCFASICFLHAQTSSQPEVITIDANAPAHRFPHYWEQMFGSGRAILSLRESYRHDLREVKQATGFQFVRFHAIFHDEVGVYREDAAGHPIYNFSYVDQIYDGLLANQVKPFVELSFMPHQLASNPNAVHAFWYKQNVSPPKDYAKWDAMIAAFANHLIERYGIDEVSSWYFEVWNEPNIDFWVGEPKQATYWELYDHTARALKGVNSHLRVGGPATAQAAWVDAFIRHCAAQHVPVDFVSTHVYGNDLPQDVFGTSEPISREHMVCRAVKKVHDQIQASSNPTLPLIWSEYNASYKNEPEITDSTYMGPWLADTVRQCDGLVDVMSYWSFSDVFEEQGVVQTPFYGGYGLIAADGIPKPAYVAFELLHKLGDQRVTVDSDSALLTRREDGSLELALWNYGQPGKTASAKIFSLHFANTNVQRATVWRVDKDHSDARKTYKELGEPRYPTQEQIGQLRDAAALTPPSILTIQDQTMTVEVPAEGLAVIDLR